MFGKCTYFDICTNGVDASEKVPAGFTRIDDIHPELSGGE